MSCRYPNIGQSNCCALNCRIRLGNVQKAPSRKDPSLRRDDSVFRCSKELQVFSTTILGNLPRKSLPCRASLAAILRAISR